MKEMRPILCSSIMLVGVSLQTKNVTVRRHSDNTGQILCSVWRVLTSGFAEVLYVPPIMAATRGLSTDVRECRNRGKHDG